MRVLALSLLVSCASHADPPAPPPPTPPATTMRTPSPSVEPPPLPSSPAATPDPVRFLAFGDMILTHRVGRAIADANDPSRPFRSLGATLGAVDFSYANLEGPLREDTPLDGLTQFGFRALNLANNHMMDGGLDRLLLTVARLKEADIATAGVGEDLTAAWKPAVVTVRGVRIAFVGASYTSKNSSRLVRLPYVARIDHRFELRDAVRKARDQADFVVAAMHAGTEYVRFPVAEQIQFARSAVEHGADLVIGTHPHVVQSVERYRGKLIFYSLGNFVFDQDRPPEVLESAAVRVELSVPGGNLTGLDVIPLENPDTLSPRIAGEKARERILRRMGLDDGRLVPGGLNRDAATPK